MTEEKTKNRGWVKNAAIIFLSLMLVLTLFSNTIKNYSLPEVAVSSTQSGAINTKIRGSGAVEANGSYDVVLNQSYKVESVSVRIGDIVSLGDTLFTLSAGDSSELKTAKDTLESLKMQYRIDLLNATEASEYAQETRDIEKAEKQLSDAAAVRDANAVSQTEIDAAERRVDEAEALVENYQEQLSGLSPNGNSSAYEIRRNIEEKQTELEAVKLAYNTELSSLDTLARAEMVADLVNFSPEELEKYMAALALRSTTSEALRIAYNAVKAIKDAISVLENQYIAAVNSDTSGAYYMIKQYLTEAQSVLASKQAAQTALTQKKTKYDQALLDIETHQERVDDLVFALEQKKKADGKTLDIEKIQFEAKRKEIEKQQNLVKELSAEATGKTVTAPQAGIIKTLNAKAGAAVEAGAPLTVIETPDLGYTLSFSVTNEQAKKVSVGDAADVSGYYWGPELKVTLTHIKNDPQNMGTNKLLVFTVIGEVESGAMLSLTIGQRSQDYEIIVPNNALRSDSKGSFVLLIEQKNVPLGTRYTATRVDVNVLASDDINTAVSGGLSPWGDYVVTTASKPIEPGTEVRLADN